MTSGRLCAALLSLLLFAATLALFYPAAAFSLVGFDDPSFITHNPIIFNGFSWDAVVRAFTGLHGDKCMYVPLLWVSFLLDAKFFGATAANPWGFHFTNVLFHAFNSVLLFLLLFAFSKKPWRAFFFAAIWALHPLRVESVAWVTERKDVLSGFFALLCVVSYAWACRRSLPPCASGTPRQAYSSRPSPLFHWLSFFFFILGLLVKPMLITLPGLLLLLDVWPLRRLELSLSSALRAGPRLLLEKLPFFLCAAGAAGAIYFTQTSAVTPAPLWFRLSFIPSNYLFYLQNFFFPFHLSAMVPRVPVTALSFLLAGGLLVATSAWVWMRRQQQPNELVGWLAFLGLLLPVIGIVLIGIYPVADRYSYLPSIGLSIALLFLLPSSRSPLPDRRFRAGRMALSLSILAALAVLTSRYLPSWQDDGSMYDNLARRHPGHYAVLYSKAHDEFFTKGDVAAADRMADQLLQIMPHGTFGLILKIICLSQLHSTEAAMEFARAQYPRCDTLHNPGAYESYLTMLAIFARQYDQAHQYMQETFRRRVFEPKTQEQLHSLALLLAHEQGDEAAALAHAAQITSLRNKTRLVPEDLMLSYTTLWEKGFYVQTLPRFRQLVQTYPDRPDLLNNIAWLLATTAGSPADPDEIIRMVRQALSRAPDHPVILDTLSVALAYAGDFDAALKTAEHLAQILAISPADDAPRMLIGVQNRIALFRQRKPYREYSSARLLHAP